MRLGSMCLVSWELFGTYIFFAAWGGFPGMHPVVLFCILLFDLGECDELMHRADGRECDDLLA